MDKDILILSAISGDQESYLRVYKKLKMYAYSIASGLFSDSVLRDDAVQQAMNEAVDKVRNKETLFKDKPWGYVKKTVSNSLIDLARLRESSKKKQKEAEESPSDKPLDPKELAWIDEGFAKIAKRGDNDSGYRVFKVDEIQLNKNAQHQPLKLHPWIEKLEEVLTYQWWWGIKQWENDESENESNAESSNDDDLPTRFKRCTDEMWNKYNLINALIDNITAPSEKRILLQYLSGFKQVEITEKQNVTKAYVSKVLSKWMRDWGWNDNDMSKARLIFLSKHLADWYAAPKKGIVPPESQHYNPKLDELYKKLNEVQADYAKEFTKVNPGWEIRPDDDDYEERTIEERQVDKIQADWIAKVRKYGFRPALEMFGGKNPIHSYWESVESKYAEIKTSPEIEAFEAEIDKLRNEIHCVIHPEFANYLKEMRGKKKAIGTTENDELELKKQKYWNALSAPKGSLEIILPTSREEAEEFAILQHRWEIEKELKAKMQETVIKEVAEFEQKKNEFYKTVTTSPKMKAYFHDLDLTDIVQLNRLFHIAEAFFRSWYPNVRINESPDYGRWSDYPIVQIYS